MGNANSGNTSKYKKVYSKKRLDEYLALCEDKEVQKVVQENSGDGKKPGYRVYKNVLKVKLPTVEGYATFLGFARRTLFMWAKDEKDFAKALEKIKSAQKQKLVEGGLEGSYNATIAKLMLSGNHGIRESFDATTDGKPITNDFTDDQINKIGDRLAGRKTGVGNSPSEKKSN